MIRSILIVLVLLAPGAAPDKEFDAAVAAFEEAAVGGTRDELQAALERLVALGEEDAIPRIQTHFAEASQRLRGKRDEVVQATYQLERKREMLAAMEVRAKRDAGLEDMVETLQKERTELERALEELAVKVRAREREVADYGDAAKRLFDRFPAGAYKKAIGTLWDDAEDHPDLGARLAAVEMLGRLGGKGSAERLHKLMLGVLKERTKARKGLPDLERDLREFEVRYQRELDRHDGRLPRLMAQSYAEQYDRLRAEPAAIRRRLHEMAFLVDAAAEAGGRALARETGDDLDKTLRGLVKAARNDKDGARAPTLDLLSHADADPVRERLRTLLAEEEEPLARAQIIDALARLGDAAVVPALIERDLADPSWHVRSRAVAALAALRARDAIPALIARLEAEEGRVRTDAIHALESLTTQRFGSNATAWRRWWGDNEATFEVPAEPQAPEGSLSAEEAVAVTFFGIKTESQRVLFVLDVSGSMRFSMVPRNNPNDDPSREYDMPQEGEESRLEVAKRELVKALGGVGEGGVVNIVLYATDVWSWRDDPATVGAETRSELVRYVESLTANGGTNIYGALRHAFDLAGVEADGEWSDPVVDTIYVLSDGRASMGLTTDSEEILSYVRERNRNAGITIHTIGLSGAQDPYLLRGLAEQNGGQYAAK